MNKLVQLSLLSLLLFSGCAKITVLRTTEFKAALDAQSDTLLSAERAQIAELKEENKRYRLTLDAAIKSLAKKIDQMQINVNESNQQMTEIMTKTGLINDYIKEQATREAAEQAAVKGVQTALLQSAKDSLAAKAYSSALAQFSRYQSEYEDTANAMRVDFAIAECHYNMESNDEALAAFMGLFKNYPQTELAPKALFKVALTYEKMKKPESMKRVLKELIERYPDSKEAERAKMIE